MRNKIVQQTNRFGRRHSGVINITGNENQIRLFFLDNILNPLQNLFLVFNHGKLIDPFSDMQVTCMKYFHSLLSYFGAKQERILKQNRLIFTDAR